MLLVAMLAMVLLAAAPALTQTALADITVGCELLYSPPGDQCAVDANGEITLPDGTTAPVLVSPAGDVFVQDTNGALTLVGTGASFITTEDTAAGEAKPTTQPAP